MSTNSFNPDWMLQENWDDHVEAAFQALYGGGYEKWIKYISNPNHMPDSVDMAICNKLLSNSNSPDKS